MIIRMFWAGLSLAFPWLVLLIHDNPGGALIALFMQVTIIGWIPASAWAMRTASEAREERRERSKRQKKRTQEVDNDEEAE
ncbi:hypothetical protein [Legionella sp. CNM-4043-24]|uniref:hypothetical protein n=1 Tax=Legionella sp. CNM-4043-24 TaxID=3421646 RepID=UPI00403AEB95